MAKNELDLRLLSVIGINPFAGNNSGARQYMFNSHLSQSLVIEGSTEKRIQTGMESEFAKFTFNVKMPCDGKVIAILEKYPTKSLTNNFAFNPTYYIIFENLETGEIDYLEMPNYRSFHQTFGFELKINDIIANGLSVNSVLAKDTVLADSPSVTPVGGYKFGIELNAAFISHPAVAEDGVLISRDVLERLAFKKYEKRVIEFGEKTFPLNLYGDDNYYKPFPDLGEMVRSDSLLGALREYDDDISPGIMSVEDVQKPDFIFDKLIYASSPQSRIIDINIFYNTNSKYVLPLGMDVNLKKYYVSVNHFYTKLLDLERRLRLENKMKYNSDKLNVSFKLHRLLVEALIYTENGGTSSSDMIIKKFRNEPLDTYKIEFTLETRVLPNIGFKLSGISGDKGVIVRIEEPENMPVDKDGVRADIITDDISTVKRMNLARLYEQYIGRACYHIKFMLRDYLNLNRHKKLKEHLVIKSINDSNYEHVRNIVLEFYEIISSKMFTYFTDLPKNEFIQHLAHVIVEGPYLYITPDHEKGPDEIVKDIYRKYGLRSDKVMMKDLDGNLIESKENVLIGPLYIMLLEKIADSWSAISSGKYQHFGVLSPSLPSEKYAFPYRNTSVRIVGETESRVYAAYTDITNIAEVMDRNNNTITHREVVNSIMSSKYPTNIKEAVNRSIIQYGGIKPLQYVKHILFASGIKITYFDSDYKVNL